MKVYELTAGFFRWLDRHRAVTIAFGVVLYAAMIALGAIVSANGPAEPQTPWTGAIGVALALPLAWLMFRPSRWLPNDEREAARARSRRAAGLDH